MKLGCLPYLNVKPLVYSMEQGYLHSNYELLYDVPSALAKGLLSNQIIAAPVSSYACLLHSTLEICSDICIASDGEVKSVLLLSKTRFEDIKSVALDYSSLSGANYTKIVLDEIYNINPNYITMDKLENLDNLLLNNDAALIIGDPAMLCNKENYNVLDIGNCWKTMTDLPSVFALWAGPKIDDILEATLKNAKIHSHLLIDEIIEKESIRLGISLQQCSDYLKKTIKYDLKDNEIKSLNIFYNKLKQLKLLTGNKPKWL